MVHGKQTQVLATTKFWAWAKIETPISIGQGQRQRQRRLKEPYYNGISVIYRIYVVLYKKRIQYATNLISQIQ